MLTADVGTHWVAYTASMVYVAHGDTQEEALARLALVVPATGDEHSAPGGPLRNDDRVAFRGYWRRLRAAVFARDGYTCVLCGSHDDLTIDHAIPMSVGGTNGPHNLQTMCRSCNHRKGDRV